MTIDSLATANSRFFDARFTWQDIDRALALQTMPVLDLVREACLIESYFALYTSKMIELFWYDIEATSIFTIEAIEAYSHFYCLRRYLDEVGYKPIDDAELRELRSSVLDEKLTNELQELVNFMGTEHFAAHHFQALAKQAREPVLKGMLARFAEDEHTHAQFAADLLRAHSH